MSLAHSAGGMTSFIIWLVVGGLIGWLASIVMRTDKQQGVLLNIVVGAVGAFAGSVVMGRGTAVAPDYSLLSLATSLAGSIVLLAVVNLIRRGKIR
jgi:uncharacterized membrane protein YeaQ/YmgE (transglycosylase-associated protein family)